jgi:hypothetical protein
MAANNAAMASGMFSFLFEVTDAPVDYDLAIGFAPLGPTSGTAFQLWDTASAPPSCPLPATLPKATACTHQARCNRACTA